MKVLTLEQIDSLRQLCEAKVMAKARDQKRDDRVRMPPRLLLPLLDMAQALLGDEAP